MKRMKKTVRIGDITHTTWKIIVVGGSIGITLPESWLKEHGLSEGDVVVEVASSTLTISPSLKAGGGDGKET